LCTVMLKFPIVPWCIWCYKNERFIIFSCFHFNMKKQNKSIAPHQKTKIVFTKMKKFIILLSIHVFYNLLKLIVMEKFNKTLKMGRQLDSNVTCWQEWTLDLLLIHLKLIFFKAYYVIPTSFSRKTLLLFVATLT
jgi:hypothetical protein